jgi:hypothetical protein
LGSLPERGRRSESGMDWVSGCKARVSRRTIHTRKRFAPAGGVAADRVVFDNERFAVAALLRSRFSGVAKNLER